jgi:mannobiose 2-epimerase
MRIEDMKMYKEQVLSELKENILPFWINNVVDEENGGFYGVVSNDLVVDKKADKGCILNSRILWTYSYAYRMFKEAAYLKTAEQAYDFMLKHFWDKEYSGIYWMVNYKGEPVDTRKQIYNIAFGIYGLTEFYKATGCEDSLEKAIELYKVIEKYSYDNENRGYIEALTREWNITQDMRLSPKDLNSKKSMNTHLHILEAYTNLFRVWKDESFEAKFKELINVTIDHIVDGNTFQFKLFFDEQWNSLVKTVSYGHDIEGSWLLYEAAELLGDEEIIEKAKHIAVKMAEKSYEDGIDREFGGLFSDKHEDGIIHNIKAWWPQAEAMVGYLNAYELSGEEKFIEASYDMWKYVDKYFVDKSKGEWFNEVTKEGKVLEHMAKVDPWKCPYHNSRGCYEILERMEKLIGSD